jgi:hypothetical protein
MQAQDPLQEIDIGNGSVKRPTYISPILHYKNNKLLQRHFSNNLNVVGK